MAEVDRLRGRSGAVFAAAVVIGVALRALRLPLHWNDWEIDYLSYAWPLWDGLGRGEIGWTRLVGSHPPQAWILEAVLLRMGWPVGWMVALPLAVSAATIWALARWAGRGHGARAAVLAAAIFAVAPLPVVYGLELNNYPWLALGAALLFWGLEARTERGPRSALLLFVGALGVLHSHALGAVFWVVAGGWSLGRRDWRGLGVLAAAAVVSGPVLAALLLRSVEAGTWAEAPPSVGEAVSTWIFTLSRFEHPALSALWGVLLLPAFPRSLRTGAGPSWVGAGAFLGVLVWAAIRGAASPWMCPYFLAPWALFVVPVARMATAGGAGRRILTVAWVAAALFTALRPGWVAPDGTEGRSWFGPTDSAQDRAAAERIRTLPHGRLLVRLARPTSGNDDPRVWDPAFAAVPRSALSTFAAREAGAPGFCFEGQPGRTCLLIERSGDPAQPELLAVLDAARLELRPILVIWPPGAPGDAEAALLKWLGPDVSVPWQSGVQRGTLLPAGASGSGR